MFLVNILPSACFVSEPTEIMDIRDLEIKKNTGIALEKFHTLPSREVRKISD